MNARPLLFRPLQNNPIRSDQQMHPMPIPLRRQQPQGTNQHIATGGYRIGLFPEKITLSTPEPEEAQHFVEHHFGVLRRLFNFEGSEVLKFVKAIEPREMSMFMPRVHIVRTLPGVAYVTMKLR
jgi:hypothetical protein